MKAFLKTKACAVCLIVLAVVLIAALCAGYYWQLPKFHDLTLELGAGKPVLQDFLTDKANPSWANFVTVPTDFNCDTVGTQEITLTHLWRDETVTLTVQDTTAPQVTFQDVTINLGKDAKPEMFVAEAFDLSPLTYSFSDKLGAHKRDKTVTVIVTDASGNSVSQDCQLSYEWLKTAHAMEYGTYLQATDLLLDPSFGDYLISPSQLEPINNGGVGEYTVTAWGGGKDCVCTVTVQDTTAPTVVLQEVAVYRNRDVKLEQFLVSATDLSGEVAVRMVTEPDTSEFGTFPITIEAEDIYGNIATVEATLRVVKDKNPPTFKGLTDMKVEKHSSPDYITGVKANDGQDGPVEFTYNADAVNMSKAGTYYVTYSAEDSSGNVGTAKRKVTVLPDQEDTTALVKEHAKKCGTSVTEITSYVRKYIRYNTNWGGDDPVWYGFTNRKGNCYVHALCLQRLMTEHGYTTKLIWVTNRSHYWLIVDMGGYWRHIDATPSTQHAKYPLMTDEQRLETLGGRKWDTSLWPACE